MKLKTTVLKASEQLAKEIKDNLLKLNKGKSFRCFPISNGFEIKGRMKNDADEIVTVVVFRYRDNPAPRIDYDANLITID